MTVPRRSAYAPTNHGPIAKDNADVAISSIHRSQNRRHVPALDYLRALAAVTICIYHGIISLNSWMYFDAKWNLANWPHFLNPVMTFFAEGHTAVSLFMVLSGYVLTVGTVGRQIAYGTFLKNRALRILPLYALLLLYGSYVTPSAFSLSAFIQTILPLANLPGHLGGQTITGLFWTVAVEVQFYLIFPLLIVTIGRKGPSFILGLILLSLVLRFTSIPLGADAVNFTYFTIFGRLDQFLLGMAAAIYGGRIARWLGARPTLPLSLALIVSMMWCYHQAGGYPAASIWKLLWPSVEGTAWALMILCSVFSPYKMPGFAQRPIAAVGTWSYSIYLCHSAAFQIFGVSGWTVRFFENSYVNVLINVAAIMPVILAFAWLTYTLIEEPFLALRRSYVGTAA